MTKIDWIRVEDEMPVDNGHVQKFLVCTTNKTSAFENCDISMCFFTNRFHLKGSGLLNGAKITHWARIEKPEDLQ